MISCNLFSDLMILPGCVGILGVVVLLCCFIFTCATFIWWLALGCDFSESGLGDNGGALADVGVLGLE